MQFYGDKKQYGKRMSNDSSLIFYIMKELPLEKSPLIKWTFATNPFIDALSKYKEVVHIWCSVVPLHPLPLVVVHVNDTKTCKKLRKLAPVQQLLEANEAVFVFLDIATLMAHETEGTLFLSLHCKKEKLVFGADDFSYSWYTESKQNEVFRQRHLSVAAFLNGYISPTATDFPVGGGYFYAKAVGYYMGVLEQLAIGNAYPTFSLRKRVRQLCIALPFTKRFFLRDKNRYFLLDRMLGDYDEENYFLDSWLDAATLLLSQLHDAVELVLDFMKALKDRKPLPPLALPQYTAEAPELKQFVSVLAQNLNIEEVYRYRTREFLVAGPIKRHYFMIVFVAPESKVTGKEVRSLLESQVTDATYQCSFLVVSKIAAQRLLYFTQAFFKDKMNDSNCIYKKDVYAPDLHWQRTIDNLQDDLGIYYSRMEDAYQEMVLFFEENIASPDALIVLPKTTMRNVLLLMFQAYDYDKLFYLDPYCDDLEAFLGLAMYQSIALTGIWNRFTTDVLDLISFFDSETDVLVDREKADLIVGFYKELHGVICNAID